MKAKNTSDLMKELNKEGCEITDYLDKNEDAFVNESIKEFWEDAIAHSGFSKSNIINKSDFSYCYFYDVINGRKIPGRDKIIRLAATMKIGIDDCQKILRASGKSALYPRVKRDSVILFALKHQYTVFQLTDLLKRHGEDPLK